MLSASLHYKHTLSNLFEDYLWQSRTKVQPDFEYLLEVWLVGFFCTLNCLKDSKSCSNAKKRDATTHQCHPESKASEQSNCNATEVHSAMTEHTSFTYQAIYVISISLEFAIYTYRSIYMVMCTLKTG